MNKLLANTRIATRIYILLLLVVIGIAGIIGLAASNIHQSLLQSRNEQTRRLVEVAAGIAQEYVQKAQNGLLAQEDAQKEALAALNALRYDEKEYFWVNDMSGILLMHPLQPQMQGSQLFDIKDAQGKNVFKEMVSIVQTKGSSNYSYYWPPDRTAQLKVSFVKSIPAWGWVIGSGVFVQDIDNEVRGVILTLATTAFGILLVMMLLASLIGRSISKPIGDLTGAMKRLADGDLSIDISEAERRKRSLASC